LIELSNPETIVAGWLRKNKIPFSMQQNFFGGVSQAGGARIDFVLTDRMICLRVQSYWHANPEARARDMVQTISLINAGYRVVDVHEEDLMENVDNVMKMAVQGENSPRTR